MTKHLVTVHHTFVVDTNDLDFVLDNMEFTQFPNANDYEFVEGRTEVGTYND
jgi:predicted transglutaminase-like cysteine proteinase